MYNNLFNMYKTISFLLVFVVFLFSCKSGNNVAQKSGEDYKNHRMEKNIKFYYGISLTDVIDRAKTENKLVFIDFVADWCAPCKLMEEEIYTYKPLYEQINKDFVSYRVDIEKENGPNLSYLYDVKKLPTLVFLDTRGRIIVKKEGSVGITGVMELASKAVEMNNIK